MGNVPEKEKEEAKRHLFRLGELKDFQVAGEDPDVRDWSVVDRDNNKLGTVNELIVDRSKRKVRYLDVFVHQDLRKSGKDHLLVPIGMARLDEDDHKVIVDEVDKELMTTLPAYRGEVISREYEFDILKSFVKDERSNSLKDQPADYDGFYDQEIYNEDRFYTNRGRKRDGNS